jgi:hypothetical protein
MFRLLIHILMLRFLICVYIFVIRFQILLLLPNHPQKDEFLFLSFLLFASLSHCLHSILHVFRYVYIKQCYGGGQP